VHAQTLLAGSQEFRADIVEIWMVGRPPAALPEYDDYGHPL
jgi:hypothetical protein